MCSCLSFTVDHALHRHAGLHSKPGRGLCGGRLVWPQCRRLTAVAMVTAKHLPKRTHAAQSPPHPPPLQPSHKNIKI